MSQTRRSFSDELKKQAVRRYFSGTPAKKVAADLDINFTERIYRWKNDPRYTAGLQVRCPPGYSEKLKRRVVEEYKAGTSGPKLARRYGIKSASTIYYWLSKVNWSDI